MLGATDQSARGRHRPGVFEEAHGEFHPQDMGEGLIDPVNGDLVAGDERAQYAEDLRASGGLHEDVHPGVDGHGHLLAEALGREMSQGLPVGDHQAPEAELLAQEPLKQLAMAMHQGAVPTAVGNHDGAYPGLDLSLERRQKTHQEGCLLAARVPPVQARPDTLELEMGTAIRDPAVTQKMLGGEQRAGQSRPQVRQASLVAGGIGPGEAGDQIGILTQGFIGASPADVVDHRHHRREVPVEADGGEFAGRGRADAAHQVLVSRRGQCHLVGEDGGPGQGAKAMDRVQAIEERDAEAGAQGRRLVALDQG